jgi:hypothetical protein
LAVAVEAADRRAATAINRASNYSRRMEMNYQEISACCEPLK